MIRKSTGLAFAVAMSLAACTARVSLGSESNPLDQLHDLQRQGKAEEALRHIDTLANRPDVSAEIRDVLDVERFLSHRALAQTASDALQMLARRG